METRTIAQRLVSAESQVQWGDARVSKQRTLVRHLERHGLGTFYARRLLKELEDTQACFAAYRDQLKLEMALSADSPAGPRGGQGVPGSSAGVGIFPTGQGIAPKL
jgi:hypothetical protein